MNTKCLYLILALVILGLVSPVPAADRGKGYILFEWFDGTRSTTNFAQITDGRSWRYPDYPTVSQWRPSFDGIDARGDWYVTRVRGYLYPPATGAYTFWITSDDQSQLYLSTDENPANMAKVCEVTGNSGATEWTKFPGVQDSAPITLQAGKKYYIEALHREGTGGDRLRVAWTGPVIGDTQTIIAGQYLSPWIRPVDLIAQNPNPADGEQGVYDGCVEWGRGLASMPVYDRIYFGADPDTWSGGQLSSAQMEACFLVEPETTYYWRVDQVEADGTVYQGNPWTFTTKPLTAWDPSPPDGARGIATSAVLEWEAGMDAMQHEVFFSENKADVVAGAPGAFLGIAFAASMDVSGLLKNNTLYFWRVDTTDWFGTKTEGPVWSFRTLSAGIADPHLVGWWKLDETKGDIAVDYSGRGNHGKLLPGTNGGLTPVAGIAGGALEFDGMDDIIDIGKNAVDLGIDGAKPKSFCAWVYTHSFKEGGIFETGARVNTQNFSLRTRGGNNQWRVQYYGADQDFTYTSLNTWVHFALVYDGTTSTCYANGVPVVTAARALDTAATLTLQIGVYNNYRFDGVIDDVRLYSKALTQEEVMAVFTRTDPLLAWNPSPTIGAVTDAMRAVPLTWSSGDDAAQHDVYLGTDAALVAAADTSDTTGIYRGRLNVNSYVPDPVLDWNDTYYWRIDEVGADGDVTQGGVWNFRTTNWLIVDDFEDYTNDYMNLQCIYQTWIDGLGFTNPIEVPGNDSGASAGHPTWDITSGYYNTTVAERSLRHGGAQSMPFYYDNTASPFYSEVTRTWPSPLNLAGHGVTNLSLWVYGFAAAPQSITVTESPAGSMSVTGAGADIWGRSDQFTFVYKTLRGDGELVARVVSNGTGINRWAKGGVMIRQNLDGQSTHAMTVITGGDGMGAAFQRRRWYADDVSTNPSENTQAAAQVDPPYWVKIERFSNEFHGLISADGVNWTPLTVDPPVVIDMTDPVLIGLCVTSHTAGENRTYQFDNIKFTTFGAGSVTGQWQGAIIDSPTYNDPAKMYVTLTDSLNKSQTVQDTNADRVTTSGWTQWNIPLSSLTGVDATRIKKVGIGVDNRANSSAGGSGVVLIDDISLTRP